VAGSGAGVLALAGGLAVAIGVTDAATVGWFAALGNGSAVPVVVAAFPGAASERGSARVAASPSSNSHTPAAARPRSSTRTAMITPQRRLGSAND